MTKLTPAFVAEYKRQRAFQLATYTPSNSWMQLSDGRWVQEPGGSGGGAAIGLGAVAAFLGTKRRFHFMETMAESRREFDRRSKASKRGWKNRKAAA